MSDFDQNNLYISDDDFMFNGSCYMQVYGRYYRQEPSVSLRPEMDGALVRRRISESQYKTMLFELKKTLNAEPRYD